MALKVIITGATGMVGEGVLLECVQNDNISEILLVGRKSYGQSLPKTRELIVKDFWEIGHHTDTLQGYDACFYCAGVSAMGKNEADYTYITYDTTLYFAKTLATLNSNMVFTFVTGWGTDSTEKGKSMWARVKGKTENDLMQLPFKGQYNFRPAGMKPVKGQKNVRWFFKPLISIFSLIAPSGMLSLHEVGKAMINAVLKGYPKQVLEVKDIRQLGA
ncbi:NAD dependent epimerase/dehydratase family protein [Filimonas lacunae]|uniref:NAD dependent epimerase/dehydratase family protein n=1 Tax=Filimonas lacunae TaxID=477680 RepID=A0A173MHJ7_9BACT|nr:NAD-dependent epimerase/dehydratase family protein [Filimonas lacunae]BAV07094.1 oxidoreductase [Filimonas lacunae]SIS95074.1 NAD dependent epimerase/dehydratase family protein [Filimonas lacunae]